MILSTSNNSKKQVVVENEWTIQQYQGRLTNGLLPIADLIVELQLRLHPPAVAARKISSRNHSRSYLCNNRYCVLYVCCMCQNNIEQNVSDLVKSRYILHNTEILLALGRGRLQSSVLLKKIPHHISAVVQIERNNHTYINTTLT